MARLKFQIQRPWIPYLIFIIALVLTLLAAFYTGNQTYIEDRLRFLNAVQDTNTNIKSQVETYIALLRGTAGLFAANSTISIQEFLDYSKRLRLDQNYAGAMGLGFIQKVDNNDKDNFIQTVQSENNNTNIAIKPAGNRSEYYVVRYLTRTDQKTPTSIGSDVAMNPVLKAAMDEARDSGLSAASGIQTAVDPDNKNKISLFVLFAPVYSGGDIPSSLEDRKKKIYGFVFIPFNVKTFLNDIFGNRILPQLVNYQIYDNSKLTNQFLLYNTINNQEDNSDFFHPRFQENRQFVIGSNTWTINYTNNTQFDQESAKNFSTIIFIGGIVISIVFFLLSRSEYMARTKAEIAASKLQASQKELQKAISHRDNFISIASHELKTPVTSLKVYAELLLRQFSDKKDEKTKDYLVKVNRQIDKLTILIQDLLNVSRIQKNQLTYRMEQSNINDITKEAVENTQQISDRHKIIIEGKVKKKIVCDKERINQVILNLLTNAIKYSPQADKIIVKLEENKKNVTISVTDFGIGISKEHQKKVFDRFYRISDTEGETYPGLGIGLFICQAIVKRHGGEISVTSIKEKGSTFRFTLPFTKKKSDKSENT